MCAVPRTCLFYFSDAEFVLSVILFWSGKSYLNICIVWLIFLIYSEVFFFRYRTEPDNV